ncbi:unnamed protein product [Rotaria sp. Silwood2]|nr:unnamed protein product [Rotaria sp. Silwood2]
MPSRSSSTGIQIKTWRAFNVGQGKLFNLSDLKSTVDEIVPLQFDDKACFQDNSWKSVESSTGMLIFLSKQVLYENS